MNVRRSRRIRNLSRFWNGPIRRKQPVKRVRYTVLCPVLRQ